MARRKKNKNPNGEFVTLAKIGEMLANGRFYETKNGTLVYIVKNIGSTLYLCDAVTSSGGSFRTCVDKNDIRHAEE